MKKFVQKIRSIIFELFDDEGLFKCLYRIYSPVIFYGIRWGIAYVWGIVDLLRIMDNNEDFYEETWEEELYDYCDRFMYKFLTAKCQRYL